jgi:hypothetical protein
MIIATAELEGISPYSQSKHHVTAKKERELPKDFEERTWRERMHVNKEGFVFIPPMAFKNCVAEIAKFLGTQIPGKGKSTYTKHFEAGILVTDEVVLPFKKADVQGEWLFLPSDGKRGSGTRVDKCYPVMPEWKATVIFYILDEIITQDVFKDHLEKAGQFIGIGRFRPRNNGFYGRFRVKSLNWQQA